MVGERLFDKITAILSAAALSTGLGCASIQKPATLQLDNKGTICEFIQAENKTEVMKCGGAEYVLKRRAPDDYDQESIISVYERKESGRIYKARTEQYKNSKCPVSMDIDLDNGSFHVEFDKTCKAWGIIKIKKAPEF